MQTKGAANEVSMVAISEVLRKRRNSVLVAVLGMTVVAVLYAFFQTKRYRAEVFLSVEDAAAQDYVKPPDISSPVNVQEKLWLIRENLFNPAVLEKVIQEFHLYPNSGEASHVSEQLHVKAWTAVAQAVQSFLLSAGQNLTDRDKKEFQLERLKSRIQIRVEASDAFAVGFEGGEDREQVTNVANRLAELLVQQTSLASKQHAGQAAGFLETEVERVKQKLEQQSEQIKGYQQRMGDELPAHLASYLKLLETLEAQLLPKKEQISNEQARRAGGLEEMKELANRGTLEAMEMSPAAVRLEELRARLKELQTRYTEQHPEIKSVETEIRNLEKTAPANPGKSRVEPSPAQLRYVQLKAEQEAIERRLKSYKGQEQEIVAQIRVYRRKVQSASEHERTEAELTRDYELTRTQYQSLLEKQNQAQMEERLKKTSQSTVFRIVRSAQLPVEPYAPRRVRIVALGLLSGLGLGLLLAVFAEYRDTTYDNADEFRNSTNLPVLAVIPALAGTAKKSSRKAPAQTRVQRVPVLTLSDPCPKPTEQIVTLSDPRSIPAEQYGFLAMQIRQVLSSQVVTVTSAAGGEGKTITSINLSVMLSRTRSERVLLIECDLRKPRIHEYLGLKRSVGFADLLRKPDDPLEPYMWRVDHLTILPGGSPISDPLEALSSHRTRSLFERLRREYQCIVVDGPPILPIADSRILADLSDGVILVVRANQTRRELFQYALQNFNVPNILGVVLNGVDLQRSRYAYAYDYYAQEYLGREERRASQR
ncbi:MAG: AAA family ATPase [Acidobacteria bacterium]|nr:AAA family ATPase [Acidobacteriota bacterium]